MFHTDEPQLTAAAFPLLCTPQHGIALYRAYQFEAFSTWTMQKRRIPNGVYAATDVMSYVKILDLHK